MKYTIEINATMTFPTGELSETARAMSREQREELLVEQFTEAVNDLIGTAEDDDGEFHSELTLKVTESDS